MATLSEYFLVGWPPLEYCWEAHLLVAGSIGDSLKQERGVTKPVRDEKEHLGTQQELVGTR